MASNIGELVATATLDVAPFQSNVGRLKTYLKGVDNSLKAMENNFKGAGKNVSNLKGLLSQTGSALSSYQKVLSSQSERYNQLKASIGDVSTATAEQKQKLVEASASMTATAAKVAELQNRYEQLAKSMRQAYIDDSAFTKFGKGAQEVGNKISQVGQTISGFGSALTKGVTAPIVAGAGLAVKAAIDYESAFAGVKKTVDETATVSYQKLSDGIRQMAKELPASAVEIANVAEVAGQLGIKAEDILAFSRTMIDMGESTNLSAEEAATAIAKIANILGLTSDEYGRFGASVVDLGNNFATTEKDIVEMTNRLAAGGKLAGLTAPEILGLATAMSSVGIEAEAGGTAMTQTLTAIGNAVSLTAKDSADDLALIAKVAGTTSEEFQKAWKEKPAEALQAFIKGLNTAREQGANMDAILMKLGMTGVRQGNMLKSLALSSDKMSAAVERSNQAWKDNTALTNEANKRYETTESQLKMFRNQVTDLAIEFGGPLIKALRSSLDAVKPWLTNLADLAKKFSSLSTEQQQNIIKWGLMAAALGPALKILGGGVTVVGGFVKAIGGLSKGIGYLSGSIRYLKDFGSIANGLKTVAGSAGAVETAVAGATTGTGLLGSAIGFLATPVGLATVALAGATAAAVYFSNKAYEAYQRSQEWGTSVSKEQAGQLQNFKDKVDEANEAMTTFGASAEGVNKVTTAVQKLATEIQKLADENLAKDIDMAHKLGLSEETIQQISSNADRMKNNVQQMSDEVIRIYQNAANNHRKLSEEEKAIVLSNQNELINTQLQLMEYSGEERINMIKAFNGQADELNTEQLKKATELTEKWAKDEQASYKERLDGYKKLMDQIKGEDEKSVKARTEIKAKMEQLEAEHTAKMEAYSQKWNDLQGRLLKTLKVSPEALTGIMNQLKSRAEEMGLTYDEMAIKFQNTFSKIQEGNSMWAQTAKDATESMKLANTQWNSMVWDEKTGKLKTNAVEEVQKALEAEGGWDAMQFILKEANLETNARLTIGEALVANGQWEKLSPEEKELVVNGKPAVKAILDSKESLAQWNALPSEIKEILGKNESFLSSAEGAKQALTQWNLMTPSEKALAVKDLASNDVKVVQGRIDSMTGKQLPIEAIDKTPSTVESVLYGINSIQQTSPIDINATDQTGEQTASAYAGVNAVRQDSPIGIDAANRTQGEVSAAGSAVNTIRQNSPIGISAQNQTTGVINSVWASLSSLPAFKFIDIITRHFTEQHAKGTNNHPGGLATVNDQRGTLYKELVTLPDGTSFIPEGRNVVLPLPPGSKVMRAGKTRSLMNRLGIPNYEKGIGFEDTKISHLSRRIQSVNIRNSNRGYQTTAYAIDSYGNSGNGQAIVTELVSLKASVENLLGKLLDKDFNTYLDGQLMAENSYRRFGNIMRREGM
ncbi:tail length tape-measure protein [Streptococcus phage Javan362]|uniref:Phage tail tape measure protein, TP901 family, core region n=1 Tax=Streptococcus oralis TaxID=1303 RepID=A0A081R6K7_STROR|nr:phage tail tape measure protein [Streptococcus oralis]KEQ50830.1 phage tail tape measure protein, TP901 family, core region [Streptococcus oralis]QBX26985.1 tail length tape-measure protein [Streptococcus phage Javan362]